MLGVSKVVNPRDHFSLDNKFLKQYEHKRPNFGFNGLGELVFYRTYSRIKQDGSKESFFDCIKRVVEGCYEIQRRHCVSLHIPWNLKKAQESAQEMFQRMWDFKFLPPGRGLWMMGTDFMWSRLGAALNNCAFISTDDTIEADPAEPFCFLMDMAMLGVGVGFDTKGKDRIAVKSPAASKSVTHVIDDSREGWVESLRVLLHSYTSKYKEGKINFDYSVIRPKGSPINGFGGTAAGPDILVELHNSVIALLDKRIGKKLSSVDITDIMNIIGKCVVAGNVRRTAEIAFGSPDDYEYSSMKDATAGLTADERSEFLNATYKIYADKRNVATIEDFKSTSISEDKLIRAIEVWNAVNSHRWASNNSVAATVGMDYTKFGEQIASNGEPGFIWLQNMRDYGRMKDGHTPGIDGRVAGSNPCVEQSLESSELCCLVETFPARHDDAADFMRTLKFAYLYAKTVTLLPTHNVRTNQVMLRNRRIGLSQSGIVQAFSKFGRRAVLRDFCDAGYSEIDRWDIIYSEWLCVPKSIKKTSVKPSGSVSLLAGATPGIHYPEASTYWRTVRVAKESILISILEKAGYRIEPSLTDSRTMVVYFAVSDPSVKSVNEVSMLEQLENCAAYQHYWADNQVSCTVKFNKQEASNIASALELYEDQLKGISFLPYSEHNYPQAPYIPCQPQEVEEYNKHIKDVDYTDYIMEAAGSNYCENDTCELKTETAAATAK